MLLKVRFQNKNIFLFFCVRLTVGWVGVLSFIVTFTFPYLQDTSLAYWLYSAISFLGFLFIAIFVPETRGKTDQEIKQYFANRKEDAVKTDA